MSLKVGGLHYDVGKQPSIPLINLGKKSGRYDDDDYDAHVEKYVCTEKPTNE